MELYKEINKELGTDYNSDFEYNAKFIIKNHQLSEKLIEKIISNSNFYDKRRIFSLISDYQQLSEKFVSKYKDELNWIFLSSKTFLSEKSIEKYKNYINWGIFISYNPLSIELIKKYKNYIPIQKLVMFQKLPEDFLAQCLFCNETKDVLDVIGTEITINQKLSESFMDKYFYHLNLNCLSSFQPLSEDFIRKHAKKLDWFLISKHQKLSDEFIKENEKLLNKELISDNWIYKTTEEKKQAVIDTGKYECYDDYFIAYKAIRPDRYSLFNFQYKYEKDGVYESWCDCSDNENSFGLSVGTIDFVKDYGGYNKKYIVVKCKIKYEDVGRVVHEGEKIRCFKISVLD